MSCSTLTRSQRLPPLEILHHSIRSQRRTVTKMRLTQHKRMHQTVIRNRPRTTQRILNLRITRVMIRHQQSLQNLRRHLICTRHRKQRRIQTQRRRTLRKTEHTTRISRRRTRRRPSRRTSRRLTRTRRKRQTSTKKCAKTQNGASTQATRADSGSKQRIRIANS